MLTLDELRAGLREDVLRIAAHRGARNIRVFGSVARGDANEHSDLDLLVEWDPGRSLLDHSALVQDLEEALGVKVHVGTERSLHWFVKGSNPSRGDAVVKDDRLYLHHMLERCRRIELFIAQGGEVFRTSEVLQDAVIRNLEVIGEAAKRVSAETRERLPELEWRAICGIRDSSSTTTSASTWRKSGMWRPRTFPSSA